MKAVLEPVYIYIYTCLYICMNIYIYICGVKTNLYIYIYMCVYIQYMEWSHAALAIADGQNKLIMSVDFGAGAEPLQAKYKCLS
jgi:hypothetical protein